MISAIGLILFAIGLFFIFLGFILAGPLGFIPGVFLVLVGAVIGILGGA